MLDAEKPAFQEPGSTHSGPSSGPLCYTFFSALTQVVPNGTYAFPTPPMPQAGLKSQPFSCMSRRSSPQRFRTRILLSPPIESLFGNSVTLCPPPGPHNAQLENNRFPLHRSPVSWLPRRLFSSPAALRGPRRSAMPAVGASLLLDGVAFPHDPRSGENYFSIFTLPFCAHLVCLPGFMRPWSCGAERDDFLFYAKARSWRNFWTCGLWFRCPPWVDQLPFPPLRVSAAYSPVAISPKSGAVAVGDSVFASRRAFSRWRASGTPEMTLVLTIRKVCVPPFSQRPVGLFGPPNGP